ncbi:MAG: hypothetical protein JWL77_6881 [Chthonomonadaceae bacterium]|nr:hypothetical protein [Chthonomonadaceae bacterium]
MSGPPYPSGPVPGSNGIGLFTIGISPIGTIPPFDVWKTVISQYANSPILTGLIQNFFEYVDQSQNLDLFFDNVLDVLTAQGYGLDTWGRIVGVSRTLNVQAGAYFAFQQGNPGAEPWGQGPFYSGQTVTSNFQLSDEAYRQVILAKAASNITNGSIPAINRILLNLFPNRGNCYATDGGDMTMTYTFEFSLSPLEVAIVGQSGVLPKPAGVSVTIVVAP